MIVAVINIKGGVGKTTTAMALATAAARAGLSATVLDTDEQSSASLWEYNVEQNGGKLPFEVRSANMADLLRLRKRPNDGFTVIDTPPTGKVTDAAKDVADFVIVPTSPTGIDLQQTAGTVEKLEEAGKPYAVLIVRAEPRTLALQAAETYLSEHGKSYFDTEIPKRADLGNVYGQPFGDDLYGYEKAYAELMEAME